MYVGHIKRTLKKRISEHIYNIEIGFKYHGVSLHFKTHHNKDPSGLKFWGVESIRIREVQTWYEKFPRKNLVGYTLWILSSGVG